MESKADKRGVVDLHFSSALIVHYRALDISTYIRVETHFCI